MAFLRNLACAAALASLCACGSSGGGSIFGNNPIFGGTGQSYCQTGTQVQLVSPTPGSYAPNTNQIVVVANGNGNQLYNTYQNWSVFLTGSLSGETIYGGQLNLTDGRTLPHPYTSDFYYSSQLQTALPAGETWSVWLTQNSGYCSAVPLQSFSS